MLLSGRPPNARSLRAIASQMLDLANELESFSQTDVSLAAAHGREQPARAHPRVNPDNLAIAETVYSSRCLRSKFLPAELFAEPAWDILLDLYQWALRKRQVSVSSLAIASNVPPTTALRYMDVLVTLGLVSRQKSAHDGRVIFIQLTPDGFAKMDAYFDELVSKSAQHEAGFLFS